MPEQPPLTLNAIDGCALPAKDGATFERRSPVDDSVVAVVAASGPADVDAAVTAARAAWRPWSQQLVTARGEVLRAIAEELRARGDELVAAVRTETGKPEKDARGELGAAIELAYFMSSEGRRFYGRTTTSGVPGKHVAIERAPVGVAGLIVAANTPLPNYAWKVFPALLCGNAVVLKPSEHTPLSAALFVEVLHAAGVPSGVVNLVHGLGPVAGTALVDHERVDLVSYTGGTEVGREIARRAGGRLAKTCLELGGKNPLVVCDDADLAAAAKAAVASAFSNAGQRCAAGSRLIVDQRVREEFLVHLLPMIAALRVDGEPDADLGPVVSKPQLERIVASVEQAVGAGAEVLAGGGPVQDAPWDKGAFMQPTLLAVPQGAPDPLPFEVFGPVTCLETVSDFEAALVKADDTAYGLTAAVHTRDMTRARRFVEYVQAGMVSVNGPTYGSEMNAPFGGFRASGNGYRECGTEVLDFYSEWKAVNTWTDPNR
jgi:acyl-CoA reductase-like NAD-dependent aldehyde dehydrogenase